MPQRKLMTAPKNGVRVRMYRQGLGDCFLLAFPGSGATPFYMLIDCGVLVGQVPGRPSISDVARHIAESTGNRLDVLVATHQHWDHLSGFVDAKDVFGQMAIGEVWFAWTEDPKDKVAQGLGQKLAMQATALHAASQHLGANGFGVALENVLGFLGADKNRTTQSAIGNVREWAKPKYLRPDKPAFDLPGGERVYVLGPPRDEAKIKRYNDKKSDPQTYHAAELMMATQAAFLAAALDPDHTEDGSIPRSPFDQRHEITERDHSWQQLNERAFGGTEAWRDISTDWIRSAATLALDMDNATNNTSVALAIELSPGGKVLLFPADAQVGNWLSWYDQSWTNAHGATVTTDDLLSRTVLYKIGHHCSHNATLQQRGLELMTSEELIALAPLDKATAEKKDWPMPWPKLRNALLASTKGRILQVDDKQDPDARPCPTNSTAAEWTRFQKMVNADPNGMYFDVVIT